MSPEQPERAPWAPCARCKGSGVCIVCFGLAFDVPDDWLASPWSIFFMLPAESFGVRSPEDFLDLVLSSVYPNGGYRKLPIAHPAFADAVTYALADLTGRAIKHELIDAHAGVIRLDTGPETSLVRHLRVALLERAPSDV